MNERVRKKRERERERVRERVSERVREREKDGERSIYSVKGQISVNLPKSSPTI